MSQKKPVALIGRLAIQLKLIDMDQLNQATAEQARTGQGKLGEIFVNLGFISEKQLEKLEQVQRDVVAKHRAKQQPASGAGPAPPATPAEPAKQRDSRAEILAAAAQAAQAAAPASGRMVEEIGRSEAPAPPPARPAAAVPLRPAPPASPAPPRPDTPPAPQIAAPGGGAAPSLELVLPDPTAEDRGRLDQLLGQAVAAGASDVHIHSGAPLKLRVNGELVVHHEQVISPDAAERLVTSSLTPEDREVLQRDGEVDFCLTLHGVGRFRANAYRQQRGFDLCLRLIPARPPRLDDLGLPLDLAKYTNYHQGMVLVTGPAGCGKSSTMAALVNLINEERDEHILSVEDPIEVIHPSKRCIVNQRHAGKHTTSFARALRGALREDPDVIVIGELRDLETISLAMTAAETGHFVLATLHTNNAVRTINRMIGAFPSNEQGQVRTMLSESLRAVISQRLVPTADGQGRVPALEVLVINRAIGNLIRDDKTVQIRSAIQTGRAHGMYLLEQSLNDLVQAGRITRETALACAEEKKLITAGA